MLKGANLGSIHFTVFLWRLEHDEHGIKNWDIPKRLELKNSWNKAIEWSEHKWTSLGWTRPTERSQLRKKCTHETGWQHDSGTTDNLWTGNNGDVLVIPGKFYTQSSACIVPTLGWGENQEGQTAWSPTKKQTHARALSFRRVVLSIGHETQQPVRLQWTLSLGLSQKLSHSLFCWRIHSWRAKLSKVPWNWRIRTQIT